MGRRTGEGTGTHPIPSELRAGNNHPGKSTKERSATEARIPGGIDGTLGAGRVYDIRRVAVNVSFYDVVICHHTDTLDAVVRISPHVRHLVACVGRAPVIIIIIIINYQHSFTGNST